MPTGIYIAGLGQSTTKESVEKYAARYIKELEYSTSGINYYTKVEKIYYATITSNRRYKRNKSNSFYNFTN